MTEQQKKVTEASKEQTEKQVEEQKTTKNDYEKAVEEMKKLKAIYEEAKQKVANLYASFAQPKQASLQECIKKEHANRKKEIEQKLKQQELITKALGSND